jgi:hypothetical protein
MPVSLPPIEQPATHRTTGQPPKPCFRAVQDQAGGRLTLELQDKTWVAVEDVDVYTTAPG